MQLENWIMVGLCCLNWQTTISCVVVFVQRWLSSSSAVLPDIHFTQHSDCVYTHLQSHLNVSSLIWVQISRGTEDTLLQEHVWLLSEQVRVTKSINIWLTLVIILVISIIHLNVLSLIKKSQFKLPSCSVFICGQKHIKLKL